MTVRTRSSIIKNLAKGDTTGINWNHVKINAEYVSSSGRKNYSGYSIEECFPLTGNFELCALVSEDPAAGNSDVVLFKQGKGNNADGKWYGIHNKSRGRQRERFISLRARVSEMVEQARAEYRKYAEPGDNKLLRRHTHTARQIENLALLHGLEKDKIQSILRHQPGVPEGSLLQFYF